MLMTEPFTLAAIVGSTALTLTHTSNVGSSLLKTQLFLCFHSSHATRIMIEFTPFLLALGTPLIVLHHQEEKQPAVSFLKPCSFVQDFT
jgi:hypothetical protein